jgi:glycerol uptake facilitator-like aquaporin
MADALRIERGRRSRALVAEGVGTAFLVAAVIGSGIMADRLAVGNGALALLANTIATTTALVSLILALRPISGAHFNPAVSIGAALRAQIGWSIVPAFIGVQVLGGLLGVGAAHLMFSEPVLQVATQVRAGAAQLLSELVATFGLVTVVQSCGRVPGDAVAYAVGLYIAGAYWFTASTSFANPAVTVARALTDTFAGIRPIDAVGFVAAQLAGAAAAAYFCRWLLADGTPSPRPLTN